MKKILAILLVVAMVLPFAACTGEETKPENTQTQAQSAEQTENTKIGQKKITVSVVHKDGIINEFSIATDEEFLGAVLEKEGLIQGKEGPYGLEITWADGEEAIYDQDKAYWALYEGEEYAMQGVDTTPIADGGTYKLVYTLG